MIKVVIVEDEPFAQSELKRLLLQTNIPHKVLMCLESVEESVEWFKVNMSPDLIFMDIQLADGLSFELFTKVLIKVPVIFTTAYDTYAIQAFKVNSIDYLLKPIELTALEASLQKYVSLREQWSEHRPILTTNQIEQLLNVIQPVKEYKSKFLVKAGEQLKFISITDIAYFYSEDNEVLLMTLEKKRYVVDYSIDQLIPVLDPKLFYRLNRAFLAQKSAIIKIHKHFNSRLKIELQPQPNEEVLVSRVRVSEFLHWMEH